ncbi:peptidase M20 domain-containing protein 2 [Arthrobacter sp. Hiyo8]|nr:peptidase M20 domain-containing protein 2 [Arthrobacter sp. Hiyo8]
MRRIRRLADHRACLRTQCERRLRRGAALALASVADELGITVKVLGTPAEETNGGKVDLIGEGFFEDVSLAMMAHAGAEDVVGGSSLAMGMWDVLYEGRPAHAAAAPSEGVNALDALVIAQTAIALARQQLPPGSVVSLIVTEGGSAVNVIPERARASVEMRSPSIKNLRVIEERVRRCLEAGALASGSTLKVTPRAMPTLNSGRTGTFPRRTGQQCPPGGGLLSSTKIQ